MGLSALSFLSALWPPIHGERERRSARLLLVSALLVLLFIWLGAAYLVHGKQQALLAEQGRALSRANAIVVEQTRQVLSTTQVSLAVIGHWLEARPQADWAAAAKLAPLARSLGDMTGGRITIRGIQDAASLPGVPGLARHDFADAAISGASSSQALRIGVPARGASGDGWRLPVSLPLAPRGQGMASLVAEIDLGFLSALIEAAREPHGAISLLRRDGVVLLREPRTEASAGHVMGAAPAVGAQDPAAVVEEISPLDGEKRLLHYQPVPGFPLQVVTSAKASAVLAPWREYAMLVAAIAVLLNIAIIAFVFGMRRHLGAAAASRLRAEQNAAADALTGVGNRRQFLQQTDEAIRQARKRGKSLSLLVLDLDYFKNVNEECGHHAGDLVLRSACKAVRAALRSGDVLARMGGDEFAVLMPETGSDEANALAASIHAAIRTMKVDTGKGVLSISASIGLACLLPEDGSAQLVLERADVALYSAKRRGRNRIVFMGDNARTEAALSPASPA